MPHWQTDRRTDINNSDFIWPSVGRVSNKDWDKRTRSQSFPCKYCKNSQESFFQKTRNENCFWNNPMTFNRTFIKRRYQLSLEISLKFNPSWKKIDCKGQPGVVWNAINENRFKLFQSRFSNSFYSYLFRCCHFRWF